MIARRQDMGNQTVAIALDRSPQSLHFRQCEIVSAGRVAERSQSADLGRDVRHGGSHRARRTEQGLFAGDLDDIAGETVDARQCRHRDGGWSR
jgi:hypothetical protein